MELHPGDIVSRLGNSLEGRTVITADQEGRFSHVGIVVDSAGCPRSRYHFPIHFNSYLPSAIQTSPQLESIGHF